MLIPATCYLPIVHLSTYLHLSHFQHQHITQPVTKLLVSQYACATLKKMSESISKGREGRQWIAEKKKKTKEKKTLHIGHLRVPQGLCLKTRVGAQPLIWKSVFHSHANKSHFHKKGCAPSFIFKVRVFGTRKWPIVHVPLV